MNRGKPVMVRQSCGPLRRAFLLCMLCGATWITQACGGSSSPENFTAAQLVAIKITPTTSLLLLASNRQLTATGVYNDGSQRDVTTNVTWDISPQSGSTTTPAVSVAPTGIVSGVALGTSVVSATYGPVVGLLQMTVNSNGYKSSNMGILTIPSGSSQIDAVYLPVSTYKDPSGVYTVQELDLDADATSSTLPVQTALLSSILMPSGFVPSATAADPNTQLVAVISYASPMVIMIDGSNDPLDLNSNTIVATYQAPVKSSVSFNGQSCMICAIEVNPENGDLLLSTAQGYYTMDLTTGVFTSLPVTSTLYPAPSFSLNPIFQNQAQTAAPYLLSPTFGTSGASQLQSVDLTSFGVTNTANLGLVSPGAVATNLLANQGAVVDTSSNAQAFLDLSTPSNPVPVVVQNLGVCPGGPQLFDMGALGVGVGFDPTLISPTFFLAQRSGNCVGFEIWANQGGTPQPLTIPLGYGPLPTTPDGDVFVNGTDPSAIATYTSVVDKKNYGLLVNANQKWIAKLNFATIINTASGITEGFLPTGFPIPAADINAGIGGAAVVFLPTNGTVTLSALSIDFGDQTVGTTSSGSVINLGHVGPNPLNISQIAVQGPDASEFAQSNTCPAALAPNASCQVTITFKPTAKGTRTATLSITDDGGNSPQTVALTGTGQ
jgi:Abnormal spindle-like microcephaly-assoc'd, ASPM-SPD-2-Hydin